MKSIVLSLTLILTAALSGMSFTPTAAATSEPIRWDGYAEYIVTSDNELQVVSLAPGCSVTPKYQLAAADNALTPPVTPSSGRGSASCIAEVDPKLTQGKVPTCTATYLAIVSGVGVVVGYARCDVVHVYCVATTGVPCIATASATSSSGGCGTLLAIGVNSAVLTRCYVSVVWV